MSKLEKILDNLADTVEGQSIDRLMARQQIKDLMLELIGEDVPHKQVSEYQLWLRQKVNEL